MTAHRVAVALIVIVAALTVRGAADEHAPHAYATVDHLIQAGERWWTTSPDPTNPVACATCHHEPAEPRGWAASFPKFRPLPSPHARVMTLLQANAEAVRRHYRLADPRPVAIAITAYLMTHGRDTAISPGVVAGQPVFPTRLGRLAESVGRGGRLYARRCAACHEAGAISAVVAGFPRVRGGSAESLEGFLEHHAAAGGPLGWDSMAMADVIGYLVAARAGRVMKETP